MGCLIQFNVFSQIRWCLLSWSIHCSTLGYSAPHTRVKQVLSQHKSGDGCLTLGTEYMLILGILSYWPVYLDLLVG